MSKVEPVSSSPPQPEVVTTNQPMYYGPPGQYPNIQYAPQPGFPQMQMMQPIQQSTNTTVVINQQPQRRSGPRDWSTGIFGCMEDNFLEWEDGTYVTDGGLPYRKRVSYTTVTGLMAWCFTPYYSCYLAGDLGESCCLPICFPPGECYPACGTPVPWLVALRVKVREANKIQGSILGDCMTVCCCPLCVMCQLKRESDFVKRHPNDL